PFLVMAFAEAHPGAIPLVTVLMAIGGTHVLATTYLLSDRAIRQFCVANPIKMILVPGVLLVGGIALCCQPGPLFRPPVLTIFFMQSWHFGAQNIGVASFISLSDRGRPLAPLDKLTIKVGIWVGMLGVLKVMSPTIATDYVVLPASVIEVLDFFYRSGAV